MTIAAIPRHPADVRLVPDWELCDRLRRAMRLVRGLDNHDVAEFVGCKPATVSTWLNGRATPSKAVQMLWADMTGVDREWLMSGTPSNEWYAIRDSNPEPADWEPRRPVLRLIHSPRDARPFAVRPRLTLIWGAAS